MPARHGTPATFETYMEAYLQRWYRINRARFDSMASDQNRIGTNR